MRWTQLKKTLEDRFSEPLRGRIRLGSTRYRVGPTCADRGWIEVDGKEVATFNSAAAWSKHGAVYHESTATECLTHPALAPEERTEGRLVEPGEFSRLDFHEACWAALKLPVQEALESSNPLVLTLALLDGRVGQRRLARMEPERLHPLPRYAWELRRSPPRRAEP
ncbi:MAG: hypothetical protein KDD47_16980 [Acidobacteria bacterium]|nr:hypothetical protein [Acidobacteriota bacterium]